MLDLDFHGHGRSKICPRLKRIRGVAFSENCRIPSSSPTQICKSKNYQRFFLFLFYCCFYLIILKKLKILKLGELFGGRKKIIRIFSS